MYQPVIDLSSNYSLISKNLHSRKNNSFGFFEGGNCVALKFTFQVSADSCSDHLFLPRAFLERNPARITSGTWDLWFHPLIFICPLFGSWACQAQLAPGKSRGSACESPREPAGACPGLRGASSSIPQEKIIAQPILARKRLPVSVSSSIYK